MSKEKIAEVLCKDDTKEEEIDKVDVLIKIASDIKELEN